MSTTHWYIVRGKHWFTILANENETAQDAFHRSINNETQIIVSTPPGITPGEWKNMLLFHAVHRPALSNIIP